MRNLAFIAAAQLAWAFLSYAATPPPKKATTLPAKPAAASTGAKPAAKTTAKPTPKTSARAVASPHSATAAKAAPPPRPVAASYSRYRAPVRPVVQQAPTPERYKEIQQALADKGYYKGTVDGQWNPDSVEALKQFQADQNLQSDGKLDALSLIGLGLGPKRMTAQTVPSPPPQVPDKQ